MTRNRIEQHPDEFRDDLNPDYRAGNNDPTRPLYYRTAYDIKDLHEQLQELRDDQLRQIPVLDPGTRLEQGATYFDLRYPERGEFKALGSMEAGPNNWYVPKNEIDYELWNLVTGEDDPARLGTLAAPE